MKGDLATRLRLVAVLVVVAGAAASCGRKGALEPPPGASAQVGAEGDQKAEQAPQSSSGISAFRAKKPKPVLPPKTPSPLDWILE